MQEVSEQHHRMALARMGASCGRTLVAIAVVASALGLHACAGVRPAPAAAPGTTPVLARPNASQTEVSPPPSADAIEPSVGSKADDALNELLHPTPSAHVFRLGEFNRAAGLDYVAVRQIENGARGTLDEHQSPCTRARDPAACRSQLEQLDKGMEAESRRQPKRPLLYLITTQGDETRVWRTDPELRQLLGEIDTPAEAWFWLYVQRRVEPYCGIPLPACERRDGVELELRARTEHRCGELLHTDTTYRVTRDGKVRVLVSSGPKRGNTPCTKS